MKRHIPGLHSVQRLQENPLSGAFLVRVAKVHYRWHPQKPFLVLEFAVVEPKIHEFRTFSGRLYCTPKALWRLNWFLRDFGYDAELLEKDQIDEKRLVNLRGIVRTSLVNVNGHSYQNLEAFGAATDWDVLYCEASSDEEQGDGLQPHSNQ